MFENELRLPIPIAVFHCASDWQVAEVNEKMCKLLGYNSAKLLQKDIWMHIVQERDIASFEELIEQVARHQGAESIELRIYDCDKREHWVRVDCAFIGRYGVAPYVMIVLNDITEQKNAQLRLKLVNEQYQLLGEVTKEITFDVDINSWTIFVAKRFFEIRGDEKPRDKYCSFSDILKQIHEEDQDAVIKTLKGASVYENSGNIEYRINIAGINQEKNYVWFRTYYRSVVDEVGNVIRVIGRSYNVDKARVIYDEAKRDALTKLFNKVETQKAVEQVLLEESNEVHAMLLIDIDDFKDINDTFGHTYGDTVIIDVANTIREQFRGGDIVGRVGGDEFLVLMQAVTEETVHEKAKTLCHKLEKNYSGGAVSKQISISVGIAFYHKDGSNYQELFEKADHAMYRAKQSGKCQYAVAQEQDFGPIQKKERRVENRTDLSAQDKEFLTFATSLMTHARNIDGSLNMLLKRILERFHLDLVAIFEEDADKKNLVLSNYYSDKFHFFEKSLFPKTNEELEYATAGQMVQIKRAAKIIYENKMKMWGQTQEYSMTDCSILAGRFEHIGVTSGYIYYVSMDENKEWEANEITLLGELSRAISVFVSLRIRMDESKKELRKMQRRDQLTGLYNFDAFQSKMKEILLEHDPQKVYAIEYLDINNFGYVNDNYGYQVGDNALKMFAEIAKSQPYYIAGCHLYSDFFVMLVADETEAALKENLNLQHQHFNKMQNHQYPASSMSICAGAYAFDRENPDTEGAFENANLAWKAAKQMRSHEVVWFTSELRKAKKAEQTIVGEFYEALYRGEFQLYLQPKFYLSSGEIYGAEALARWKKQDGRILFPGEFLEPLEKIGYVTELDFFIFEELLKTMEKWNIENKKPIVVSTNFSGRHFERDVKEFIKRIENIFQKYHVCANQIELEITEGVFIQNKDALKECMATLREMGFRIAIDDFGTGYSSLSVLTDIPVDVVKMDKSFIDKADSKMQRKLIAEIGKLIQIAGKDVIFEGIETDGQKEFLTKSGFCYGQGYLCNKPIPKNEFESLYMKNLQ